MEPFEDHEVIASRVAITNAGDGLSEAMSIAGTELRLGERVHVVLECVVAKVRHEPASRDDAELLARVHFLRAGLATIVPESVVRKALAQQRRSLDEAAGRQALFAVDGEAGE
jgi:hypothetical protein